MRRDQKSVWLSLATTGFVGSALAQSQVGCLKPGLTTIDGVPTSISCTATSLNGYPASLCYTTTLKLPSTSVSSIQIPSTSSIKIPITTSIQLPSTTSIKLPSTTSIQLPSTSSIKLPTTTSIQLPSTTKPVSVTLSSISLPTTSAVSSGFCGGNAANCGTMLINLGAVAESQVCWNCDASAIVALAKSLAKVHNSLSYAFDRTTAYALKLNAKDVGAAIDAGSSFMIKSDICSQIVNKAFIVYDVGCDLSPTSSSKTTTSMSTTTKMTTAPLITSQTITTTKMTSAAVPTTLTTSMLPTTKQCSTTLTFCSGQIITPYFQITPCTGLLNGLLCTVSDLLSTVTGTCLNSATCNSYGISGTTTYTSILTVDQLQAAISAHKASVGGTCAVGTSITLSDRNC